MPAPILTAQATVMCPHAAPALVAASGAKVLVSGMPAALISDTTTVAGCPLSAALLPSPCVSVTWIVGSARVLVNGQPVLLQTSSGLALAPTMAPQGSPLIVSAQTRVMAS